jgi:hypothetical protein
MAERASSKKTGCQLESTAWQDHLDGWVLNEAVLVVIKMWGANESAKPGEITEFSLCRAGAKTCLK